MCYLFGFENLGAYFYEVNADTLFFRLSWHGHVAMYCVKMCENSVIWGNYLPGVNVKKRNNDMKNEDDSGLQEVKMMR